MKLEGDVPIAQRAASEAASGLGGHFDLGKQLTHLDYILIGVSFDSKCPN